MIHKKYLPLLLLFNFTLSFFIFNSFTFASAQQSTNNKSSIKIGTDLWAPNLLAFVAQEKGYFKQNNVDVNVTIFRKYGDEINSYSNGDLDGLFGVYSDMYCNSQKASILKLYIIQIHL